MGSNPYDFIEEDLPCPVCKKTLSSPGTPPKIKNKFKKRTNGRPAPYLLTNNQGPADAKHFTGKTIKDNEEIVVAQCGHLFHKFCLRHYCYLYREGQNNSMCRVSCPLCQRNISMMSSQCIEYKVHQDKVTNKDKELTQTSVMHSELSGQLDSASSKLGRLSVQLEDGSHNLEMFRSHWKKIKGDVKQAKLDKQKSENLKNELQNTDKMLSFMQAQHLKIVRKFIAQVKQKSPKNFIYFPTRLAPYLTVIETDDRMVRDLGEVIVPIHLNNLKSDRQSLLKGIMVTAGEKLKAEKPLKETMRSGRSDKHKHVKIQKQDQKRRMAPPRVIVKVRRSSVSILSSSVLTKESFQKIMKNVKNIPAKARNRIRIEDPEGKKKVTDEGLVLDHLSSSSDIKVLFMPKRQALHQYSEPCRNIEESDSFQVKVPTRRCKSTDAVIIKTKTKDKKHLWREESPDKRKVERKRSNSVAAISTSKERIKERIKEMEIVVLNPNSETARCITNASEPRPDLEITPEEYEHVVIMTKQDYKGGYKEERKCEGEGDPNNNDLLLLDDYSLTASSVPASPRPNLMVGHCEINMPATPATPLPGPRTSLLETIYDQLEEEKNFQSSKSYGSLGWASGGEDTNGNESQWQGSGPTRSEQEWACQPPQFFRVDNRGILRHEDPRYGTFRQPTFLCSSANLGSEKSEVVTGYDESDEENQLRTLSPEERVLIASEKEAGLTAGNFGSGRRRPVFHGVPACLGMSHGKYRSEAASIPHNTPFYLRKWQQQLYSGRNSKQWRKSFSRPQVSATKLNHAGQAGGGMNTGRSHNVFQQRQFTPRMREEPSGNFLPPLSMYPVKRPSTAECARMTEFEYGDYNRAGTAMILSGNYDTYNWV